MKAEMSERTQEEILEIVRDKMQHNRYAQYNHFVITEIARDHVVVETEIIPDFCNASGSVHGGLYYTLSDFCGATTARTDGREYVTLSAQIHYLRAVSEGRIRAIGRIIKRGRTTVLSAVEVFGEGDTLLTTASVEMYCVGDSL